MNKIAVSFLIAFSSLAWSVENSVIPLMEKFEKVEALPAAKYSKGQWLEVTSTLERKEEKIRVATYNVLFDLYDEVTEEVYRWPARLPRLVELLEEMEPDVLCVQELYTNQYHDLMPFIEDRFSFYSIEGEHEELNGIFYRKDRFEVLGKKIWFMGPSEKTLTMVHLKDIKTEKELAVFNTHLSFGKIDARDFQARFIARTLESYIEQMPVIFAGDLNTFSQRLDLKDLPFYDGDYIQRLLSEKSMRNAREVSLLGHLGPIGTFSNNGITGVPFQGTGTPGIFLDHIFVSKDILVLLHAVQPGTVSGYYPSDHFPVLIDLIVDYK